MIAIVDYGMGNLRSVEKGFLKVGIETTVTSKPEVIEKADGVVLPGVGAFRDCMKELKDLKLIDAVVETIKNNKPYLGICLGLQVLFSESEEFGRCRGLDIFRGKVMRFPANELKVPHMGWNDIKIQKKKSTPKWNRGQDIFLFCALFLHCTGGQFYCLNYYRVWSRVRLYDMERQRICSSVSPGKKPDSRIKYS